jgi:hypothetical protein
LVARKESFVRVPNEVLRFLEPLFHALYKQEAALSHDRVRAKVKLFSSGTGLGPEIRLKRRAVAGTLPEFFGILKKDFQEGQGFGQRAGRQPIRRRPQQLERPLANSLVHRVAERGDQI